MGLYSIPAVTPVTSSPTSLTINPTSSVFLPLAGSIITSPGNQLFSVATADINGDGKVDLYAAIHNSTTKLMLGEAQNFPEVAAYYRDEVVTATELQRSLDADDDYRRVIAAELASEWAFL